MIVGSERIAIDIADAQALKRGAVSGDPDALRSAARQFESLLISQMFKTMRETSFSDEDDPMTGGDGVKLYREMLDQQWASKISNGRGLGFAEMMVKAMEGRGSGFVSASALTNPASPFSGEMNAGVPPPSDLASRPVASPLAGLEWAAPGMKEGVTMPAAQQTAPAAVGRKQVFLETMRPHAEAASAATGVPSRFILAHAALESGWGEREIRGQAGEASHNLFGIKAGRNWDGASVQTLTTEYRSGIPMKLEQNFRAYDDYSAGFTDYAKLLQSRYGAALAGGADADVFANGLAAGGYATDPAYAGKLKSVIASVAMAGG